MTTKEAPVIVEQLFQVPVQVIWEAITNVDKMKCWYFENIPNFKPEVGFKTAFDVQSDTRNFHHIWTVTDVIPLKKISYKWQFSEYEGESFSHFEIEELGTQTILRLTAIVTKVFSDEIPEFKRESCLGGWNYFIKDRLKNYIETNC
tara:strand:- start:33 stop:473 length:441 start_codon:yes stop_codon:yes gene_type:complete